MNRIKQLRRCNNWTQDELGNMIQVQKAAVSKYETGAVPLTDETILKLSQIFNVSTDYLLGRTDEKTHPSKKDGYAVIRYDSEKLNELMAVISALPESEQEKLLDFAKFQSARLDKLKGK